MRCEEERMHTWVNQTADEFSENVECDLDARWCRRVIGSGARTQATRSSRIGLTDGKDDADGDDQDNA